MPQTPEEMINALYELAVKNAPASEKESALAYKDELLAYLSEQSATCQEIRGNLNEMIAVLTSLQINKGGQKYMLPLAL